MDSETTSQSAAATFRVIGLFFRDFVAFSGARFWAALVYVMAGALFESIGLVLLVPLLALVAGNGTTGGFLQHGADALFALAGVSTPFGRLALLLGLFVLLMILRGVVLLLRDRAVQALQTEFVEDVRARIMRALASAGWEHVLRLRHARIMHAIGSDIQRVSGAVYFLLQSGISLAILVFQCVLAFWLAPVLALFAFGLLIAGGIALVPVLRRARALGEFVSVANLALTETTGQFLSGLKQAISEGHQEDFTSEFHATLASLRMRQLRYSAEQAGGRMALTILSALVGAVTVLIGYGWLGIGAPVLIAFLLIIARMIGPVTQIQQGGQQLAYGLPAYEKSLELLGELKPATQLPANRIARRPEGTLVLENVSYRHPAGGEEQHAVTNISLRVLPGSFLGISGPSGAGKTTLLDLVTGLLRPQSGRILVDNVPLADDVIPSWRMQLSYVVQDAFLFHESVRSNLLWANPKASEQELWDALALTGADTVVRRMSGGLDTVVGERGSLMSGGERQRIALARALLRKPQLLVIDEATNAIDIPAERVLLAALRAIRPKMTMIMVAHRPESLALCDTRLVLENGVLHAPSMAASAG